MQGFLTKLGLTRSYVLVNAYAYALLPTRRQQARRCWPSRTPGLAQQAATTLITGPALQAIVAFGAQARRALELWDSQAGRADVRGAASAQPRRPQLLARSGGR